MFKEVVNIKKHQSSKLVYSGLYYSVDKKIRYSSIIRRDVILFMKSKNKLIEELGISKAQFYRAINELEEKNLITSYSDEYGITYYELKHHMELNYSDIKAIVTTQMLKEHFIIIEQKTKTFSANSKIILGILSQESRQSYKREITTSINDLRSLLEIPKSTIYHLIKQFVSNTIMSKEKKHIVFMCFCYLMNTQIISESII